MSAPGIKEFQTGEVTFNKGTAGYQPGNFSFNIQFPVTFSAVPTVRLRIRRILTSSEGPLGCAVAFTLENVVGLSVSCPLTGAEFALAVTWFAYVPV